MALEQYRALAQILRTPKFTVQSLQEATGIKPATLRTTLRRYESLFETAAISNGRRGGRVLEYALRADRRADLTGVLKDFYVADEPGLNLANPPSPSSGLPVELGAAEFLMGHRLSEAEPTARAVILDRVDRNLRAAERQLGVAGKALSDPILRFANALGIDDVPNIAGGSANFRLALARARLDGLRLSLAQGDEEVPSYHSGVKEIAICPPTEADEPTAYIVRGIFQGHDVAVNWLEAGTWAHFAEIHRPQPLVFGLDSRQPDIGHGVFLDHIIDSSLSDRLCIVDAGWDSHFAAKLKSANVCYVPNANAITYNGLVQAMFSQLTEIFGLTSRSDHISNDLPTTPVKHRATVG